MQFTRRGILLGIGAAGGLVAAWALTPRQFAPPLTPADGEFAFDAWLKIGKDGVVSVAVPDLEMGQGISTLIPQIVAMELGADWRQVAVEPAPVSGAYGNAVLAARWSQLWMPLASGLADEPDSILAKRMAENDVFVATADGTSIAAHEAGARAAAAGARAMLAMAAAAKWGVSWEECEAQDGFILNGKNKLPFSALVEAAAGFSAPNPPVLRASAPQERGAEFPPGAPLRFVRLDLPSKVDGSHLFAGDVRLPDLVHASIRHAPIGEAKLGKFDAKLAAGMPGFLQLVEGPDWLAATGTSWWSADQALSRVAPQFSVRQRADSGAIGKALREALRFGDAHPVARVGDPEKWLRGKFEHTALYNVAPALHAGLETGSATARFENGRLELWAASQAPQSLRMAAAKALDISLGEVTLYPVPAGGSFDARLDADYAVEAAMIARQVKKPVQLTWSRWQEHLAVHPRAPARAVLAARTTADGSLNALEVRVAMPSSARELGARLFGSRNASAALDLQSAPDRLAGEGFVPPYAVPHLKVEHVPVATGLPTGRMRGNSHGIGAFLVETFIDELAHRSGREPLSYRMTMLANDPRLATCLQRAATLAEWGGGGGGSGQGLACWTMRLGDRIGRIALVASARRDERGIRVDKLTAVVDIGRIVNVDIARQQIEGGLIFGMGLANGSSTSFADGLPETARLGLLGLPQLRDCPEMLVEFIEGNDEPFDPGELGAVIAPPAIANALFSAGSVRLHHLPLTAEQS